MYVSGRWRRGHGSSGFLRFEDSAVVAFPTCLAVGGLIAAGMDVFLKPNRMSNEQVLNTELTTDAHATTRPRA